LSQPGPPVEVVASDLEGTLTTGETWRSVVEYVRERDASRRYSLMVVRNLPHLSLARIGLIDRQRFRDRWLASVAGLLRGMEAAEFAGLAQRIVDRDLWPNRRPVVIGELEAHRQVGRRVILCSGTFQPVLDAFAHLLDAEAHGTRLEEAHGRLTGRLLEPPNTGSRKAARLAVARDGAMLRAAYGDSLADVAMLEQSREAVTVHPEGKLRDVALDRGWRVIEGT